MSLGRTIDDVIPLLHTVWRLPVEPAAGVPLHASTKAASPVAVTTPTRAAGTLRFIPMEPLTARLARGLLRLSPSATGFRYSEAGPGTGRLAWSPVLHWAAEHQQLRLNVVHYSGRQPGCCKHGMIPQRVS